MRPRVNYDDGELVGVYSITSPSGKVYVGMTCDSFDRRWRGHRRKLQQGKHTCAGLQRSYDKYGWEQLGRVVLEHWQKPGTREELLDLERQILLSERRWWESMAERGVTMLNGCPTGTGSVLHSEETRAKMSASNRARMELPADEFNHLQELVGSCKSRAEVETATGMSLGKLRRRGIILPSFGEMSKKAMWNADLEELERMYHGEGMTTTEMAEYYSCSQQNMYRYMKRLGVVFRRRGTREK